MKVPALFLTVSKNNFPDGYVTNHLVCEVSWIPRKQTPEETRSI